MECLAYAHLEIVVPDLKGSDAGTIGSLKFRFGSGLGFAGISVRVWTKIRVSVKLTVRFGTSSRVRARIRAGEGQC